MTAPVDLSAQGLDALERRLRKAALYNSWMNPDVAKQTMQWVAKETIAALRARIAALESVPVSEGSEQAAEWLDLSYDLPKHKRKEIAAMLRSLDRERARLEQGIVLAREVAMIAHCDVNRNGKTILDFHEVWLRQAHERAERDESALAAMTQRAEAAERDAKRYRWLRVQDSGIRTIQEIFCGYVNFGSAHALDAAIDAAIQSTTSAGEGR